MGQPKARLERSGGGPGLDLATLQRISERLQLLGALIERQLGDGA